QFACAGQQRLDLARLVVVVPARRRPAPDHGLPLRLVDAVGPDRQRREEAVQRLQPEPAERHGPALEQIGELLDPVVLQDRMRGHGRIVIARRSFVQSPWAGGPGGRTMQPGMRGAAAPPTMHVMTSTPCSCGSGRAGDACCGPLLAGAAAAGTAEALMRSRYCAYVHGARDY